MAMLHVCDCCGEKAPNGKLLSCVSFFEKGQQIKYDTEPLKAIKRIELCENCFTRLLLYVEENFENLDSLIRKRYRLGIPFRMFLPTLKKSPLRKL